MEKKSTKIAYFVALGIFIVLLVILGLQFKGKENPVFVGDGAFYTTGDGVFLDGILKTADDSEGSKYALDGSYYVSPEAGTYFELSEDGNTIVGADEIPKTVKADSVVLAIGYNSAPLSKPSRHVHIVGDALRVGNLRTVIWRAWDVATKL